MRTLLLQSILARNKYHIFTVFLFLQQFVFAQNYETDFARIQKMGNDTAKVSQILQFVDKYYFVDDSVTNGYPMLLKAYQIAKEKNSPKHIADVAYAIGDFYNYFKNNIKATEYFIISLKNAELINYISGEAHALMGLGINYYAQKKWNEALAKFNESIQMYQKIHSENEIYTPLYLNGLVHLELHNFDQSKKLLTECLLHAKANGDLNRENECLIGIARVYTGEKKYNEAAEILQNVLPKYQFKHEKVGVILIHYFLGKIYFETNNLPKALNETEIAYQFASETKLISNSLEITDLLTKIHQKLGNYEQALNYLNINHAIRDTLYNRDVSAQITISNANYEFEKKENALNEQISENKRHKNQLTIVALLFALVSIAGILAYIFIRKARKKSETLLLNILPKEAAEELKINGKVTPKMHTNVSILFCDVVNFTKICENLKADSIVSILDIYFCEFDRIIAKNKLEKIKTIGDSYMCTAGLHNITNTDAQQCVQAAIDIINYTKKISEEIILKFGFSFHFRIGIHTGNVVSGIVGESKYAYDIWGDAVNIAARMEQQSEMDKINISGATYELINAHFKTTYRGKINAKNKHELDMYFVEF